jgi:hypothetical protein
MFGEAPPAASSAALRRDDHAYLSRLTLLPRHSVVRPGQPVVAVEVGRMGSIRRWPGRSRSCHE